MHLKGKPIYLHSVELFLDLGYEVILVTNLDLNIPNVKIVKGGKTRGESVYNGILETSGDVVFVHDAARPMLTKEMVLLLEESLGSNDGVYLAKRVTDSIKHLNDDKYESVDRNQYILAETPQVFKTNVLKKAYDLVNKSYTDEVSLVEDLIKDAKIKPVFHTGYNDKITVYEDYIRIKKLIGDNTRIGHSFDIHKLVLDRKLVLGGVEIDSKVGLLGHSDADVLLHAVTEAIIGALGIGDLGTNFSDNSPQFKDISSQLLLEKVINEMEYRKYGISNIDISLYLETPKMLKYRDNILSNLQRLLKIEKSRINFKVTTTEKIGPIGQNEAIAAEAVVIIEEV